MGYGRELVFARAAERLTQGWGGGEWVKWPDVGRSVRWFAGGSYRCRHAGAGNMGGSEGPGAREGQVANRGQLALGALRRGVMHGERSAPVLAGLVFP